MDTKTLSDSLKIRARELGFDLVGIAPAHKLERNGKVLQEWCNAGMNADMTYMARNIEKRTDPLLLLPGTRSVIVTGLSYYVPRQQGGCEIPVLSRYAYGENYHDVIMPRLRQIIEHIKSLVPGAESKCFVDSAPVFEKGWASQAGLGWQGRHSILVNREMGSFFFLGVVLTSAELEYDVPGTDHCGSCRLCIEACPTRAINENRTINAARCISYMTIESKEPVKKESIPEIQGRIFGCDICQEACPWNKKAAQHKHPEFNLPDEIRNMTAEEWLNLSKEDFKRLFRKSAIGRMKYEVFIQNVTNVTKHICDLP
ncbi:MAG TPA: tRNA epoxyqueuosine(34) reductase QueG [Bacteroidales bacterium]|nr:tRNA epoxyqueuosine(34) reductase QueG [Bacteroidales bacterium]